MTEARRTGYSVTSGELQPGAWGLAAPIQVAGRPSSASVGIVTLTRPDVEKYAPQVIEAAHAIARTIHG